MWWRTQGVKQDAPHKTQKGELYYERCWCLKGPFCKGEKTKVQTWLLSSDWVWVRVEQRQSKVVKYLIRHTLKSSMWSQSRKIRSFLNNFPVGDFQRVIWFHTPDQMYKCRLYWKKSKKLFQRLYYHSSFSHISIFYIYRGIFISVAVDTWHHTDHYQKR